MNIAMVLANAAKAFANRPAVCLGHETVHNYAQLLQRSAALGAALRAKGFAPGSRVGVFLSNRPEYFEILFGAWFAGLAVAPINAKLHPKELAYILDNCAASVLFTDIEGGLSQPGSVIDVDGADYRAMLATTPADLRPAQAAPEDNAWLFYTSGTTGYPKGAMLTHRNLYNMTMSFLADIGPVDETDASLYPAPLSHGAGLLALAHLVRGAANVVPESGGFEPGEIVDLINHYPGSSFFAAPTMVNRLVLAPSHGGPQGGEPRPHLLRRRADVCGRSQARAVGARSAAVAGLWPGRVAVHDQLSAAPHAPRQWRRPARRAAGVGGHCPHRRRGPRRRCRRQRQAARRERRGDRIGRRRDGRLLEQPNRDGAGAARRLAVDRRCRHLRRARLSLSEGSLQGRHHLRRLEHLSARGRGGAAAPSRRDARSA